MPLLGACRYLPPNINGLSTYVIYFQAPKHACTFITKQCEISVFYLKSYNSVPTSYYQASPQVSVVMRHPFWGRGEIWENQIRLPIIIETLHITSTSTSSLV